jgi:hypothetical protein
VKHRFSICRHLAGDPECDCEERQNIDDEPDYSDQETIEDVGDRKYHDWVENRNKRYDRKTGR